MDSRISPAFLIRSYIWAVLKANDPSVWDTANYGGLVPIVPLDEEPELTQYEGPHIVYGYALSPSMGPHARRRGSMTFAIYDQSFARLTKTLVIMEEALGRDDETARDINNFTTKYDPAGDNSFPYIGMRFGFVSTGFVEGGTPESTEGGRQSGLINVRFEYYVDYQITTSV